MGPRWARRPEEGSPQESAGVPANTRERARKRTNRERLTFMYWWRRRELNPRPSVRNRRFYMLSRSFDLAHRNPADRARGVAIPVRF